MVSNGPMSPARSAISAPDAHRVLPTAIGEDRSAHLNAAIEEIVRMAGITNAAQRTRLRSDITRLVKKVWHREDPKVVAERAQRSRATIERALLARSAFEKAAAELKLAFAEYDKMWGKHERIQVLEGYSPSPFKRDSRGVARYVPERTVDEFLSDIDREFPKRRTDELLNEVLLWAKNHPPPRASIKPRRGRPADRDLHFFYFVCVLSSVVCDAGGKLTLDKNYPWKASLPRALHLLRPHLPRGYISVKPSVRQLVSARKAATRPLLLRLAHSRLSGY
jgi:hypothetical protein